MIAFALGCPPQLQHDYFNLDRHNPYASAKMLARLAYARELPAALVQKTHKTSYALMARRMFHNSASTLYALATRPMLLDEWGLVDQARFRRQLMAYIVAMEDPNANPGIHYHYLRGVCDLETWLRRFSGTRAQIETRLKLQPLRRLL
jgi:asparagine synthase (glutamine-hydrolysing)